MKNKPDMNSESIPRTTLAKEFLKGEEGRRGGKGEDGEGRGEEGEGKS